MHEKIIYRWIKKNSRVLDLGCGDGRLLFDLKIKGVDGLGIEIDADKINTAIQRGVHIIEQDLNEGLARFKTQSFDTVVMAHSLQATRRPDALLLDMLRVGREGVVTFPNFAYWQNRAYLGLKGMMPVSKSLPFMWYDTPNIHLCTFKDFEILCQNLGIKIIDQRAVFSQKYRMRDKAFMLMAQICPNLMADVAVYRLTKP